MLALEASVVLEAVARAENPKTAALPEHLGHQFSPPASHSHSAKWSVEAAEEAAPLEAGQVDHQISPQVSWVVEVRAPQVDQVWQRPPDPPLATVGPLPSHRQPCQPWDLLQAAPWMESVLVAGQVQVVVVLS